MTLTTLLRKADDESEENEEAAQSGGEETKVEGAEKDDESGTRAPRLHESSEVFAEADAKRENLDIIFFPFTNE